MLKCIYCLKDDVQTTFNNREHIIPQFLGKFSPLNLLFKGDIVCDQCNNEFSSLETNFKEDSEEGIYGQMLNIEGNSSIRLRGKNVELKFKSGMEGNFFDNIFPFLRWNRDKFVIEIKPQVQLKNYEGIYQIFLPEALERIKKNKSEFQRVKNRIAKLSKKDIKIFAGANYEDDNKNFLDIVNLVKNFGIDYKEKEKQFSKLKNDDSQQFEIEMNCKVNRDMGRILAKIAFNYFAYCAYQDNQGDVLYQNNFEKIRKFIKGDKSIPLKEIVVSVDKNVILDEERKQQKRLVAHLIIFEKSDNNVIIKETFWGKRVYEIVIGTFPDLLQKDNFGCGHAFNPFKKQIYNLSQRPKSDISEKDLKATFGLFKKIRV